MNIRIDFAIVIVKGVYDYAWLLRCGRIIEVDEWFSVDSPLEYWEIFSDSLYVHGRKFLNQTLDLQARFDSVQDNIRHDIKYSS